MLSANLTRRRPESEDLFGFCIKDVEREVLRASRLVSAIVDIIY